MANPIVFPILWAGTQSACIPADEADRLTALRNLDLLDTPPFEAFDCLTRLAAEALDVPIVLMSLVDENRQWFKSRFGLSTSETSREVSFCAHAVFNRKPLIVPDATQDARFAGNPLVTGAPQIRAYLGIPLFTRKGHPIGTVCAIDTHANAFGEDDQRKLADCAKLIEVLIHTQELAKSTAEAQRLATEREQLFRDIFEQAAVGIVHSDLSGRLLRVNERASHMLGYTVDELQHKSFIDITHPEDVGSNTAYVQRMVAGELDTYRIEKRYIRKDGTSLWAQLSVALKRTSFGTPAYIIAVIEDIADRKEAQLELIEMRNSLQADVADQTARLREANHALQHQVRTALDSENAFRIASKRLRAITDNVPAMIAYWNCDWRCEFANKVYRDWFGIDPKKMVGMHLKEFLGDTQFSKVEPHVQVALEGHAQRFETTLTRSDGDVRICLARYIPDFDAAGQVKGFFVFITDVTASRSQQRALQEANAKLTADSITDYLTGLSNRRVFSERSEEACRCAQKDDATYGLILLDLDNFKQINDVYGHDVGDEVLRVTGKLLNGQLRSHRDVAARLGGEEFAVLCFGYFDEELLRVIAERLRAQINRETVHAGKKPFNFSGSFGLALSNPMDSDWKTIYARADAALYEAKARGKNRVIFGKATSFTATGRFRALRAFNS